MVARVCTLIGQYHRIVDLGGDCIVVRLMDGFFRSDKNE